MNAKNQKTKMENVIISIEQVKKENIINVAVSRRPTVREHFAAMPIIATDILCPVQDIKKQILF